MAQGALARVVAYLEEDCHVGYALGLWRIMFGFCLLYTGFRTLEEVALLVEYTSFMMPLVEGLPVLSVRWLWVLCYTFDVAVVLGPILGLLYRPCMVIITAIHTYFFMLSKTAHNNHYYLISILCGMLTLCPADQNLSVPWRTLLRKASSCVALKCKTPKPDQLDTPTASDLMPRWYFLVHQWQIALVYFFAGVAKIDGDWLQGRFMFKVMVEKVPWLPLNVTWSLWQPFGDPFSIDFVVLSKMAAWGGCIFDTLVPIALLWPRTRWLGLGLNLAFHGANSLMFTIGIFPLMMVFTNLLFVPTTGLNAYIRKGIDILTSGCECTKKSNAETLDAINGVATTAHTKEESSKPKESFKRHPKNRCLMALFGLHFLVQAVVPLRHFVIPSDVNWSEEGHRYSWHMKLRTKMCHRLQMTATDPATGRSKVILEYQRGSPPVIAKGLDLFTAQINKMCKVPDMLTQAATLFQQRADRPLQIRATAEVSMNLRPPQLLVDPNVDLVAYEFPPFPAAAAIVQYDFIWHLRRLIWHVTALDI
eukprot:INCI9174.4.p1 GENE.INCI9174.4~~INCI9174.4.p1  ORF type:complete len:559 (-),score=56.32 INCI9174.4:431-2032(-)